LVEEGENLTPKVKIVTDSSAYPEPAVIKKYDIHVVPLKVAFGADVYSEGVDITVEEFYRRLAKYKVLPTTSQPSVGDFTKVYLELTQQGHSVLSFHISSKLSGTVASALAARNALPQAQIEIIDSHSVAMGMMIAPAAEALEEGKSLSEVKTSIERLNKCIDNVGVFDTLEYLWRGGRIGAARALVGTLLRIKPVLTHREGDVKILTKARTMNKAIDYMLKFVEKQVSGRSRLHGWICHGHVLGAAHAFEKRLRENFDWVELRLFELGPVLGTHMGPGFFGLSFYCDEDWQAEKSGK
jgi:DegV family protein with EDD domain